jgi:hypothetical protein
MKILIVEPRKHPRRADIPHTLEEMQRIVGGDIQAIYPFEDRIAIVCDEESKIKGYELNRSILNLDVIAGTFFICGIDTEDFTDLPDDLAEKYEILFYKPEFFAWTPMGIMVFKADGTKEIIR